MRTMTEIAERIGIDPNVRSGQPVVYGTRVTVDLVLDQLASGMTPDEVAEAYKITREDVLACIRFAKQEISHHRYGVA